MRDRMSRPDWSVPRTWAALPPASQTGGRRRRATSWSSGSWGAMTGAASATATFRTRMARPMAPARLRTSADANHARPRRGRGPGGAAATCTSSPVARSPSAKPARTMRRVQLQGGARRPPARRSHSTSSGRPRAPSSQMGPCHRSRPRCSGFAGRAGRTRGRRGGSTRRRPARSRARRPARGGSRAGRWRSRRAAPARPGEDRYR